MKRGKIIQKITFTSILITYYMFNNCSLVATPLYLTVRLISKTRPTYVLTPTTKKIVIKSETSIYLL